MFNLQSKTSKNFYHKFKQLLLKYFIVVCILHFEMYINYLNGEYKMLSLNSFLKLLYSNKDK